MNIEQSPRYMKALQKMARMNPSQKAIFDAGLLHAQFADENMRKRLIGMRDAATELGRKQNLESGKQNLEMGESRLGLAKDINAANFDIGQRSRALSEKQRLEDLAFREKQRLEDLAFREKQYASGLGLRQKQFDIEGRDRTSAEILGAGGAALNIVQGYQDMKNKAALARKYKSLGGLYVSGFD